MERERRREIWLAGCVDQEGGGIAAEGTLVVLRRLTSADVRRGAGGRLDGLRRDAGLDDKEATIQ